MPGLGSGAVYKYDICGPDGTWHRKADPMADPTRRPRPLPLLWSTSPAIEWADKDWMAHRPGRDPLAASP